MVIRKNLKVSRDEAIRYMFMESSVFSGIASSVFSSLVGFFLIFYLLYLTQYFFPISLKQLLIIMGIFLVLGVLIYFIKREEFVLYEKTSSDVFVHGLFSYPIYILIYAGILLYFLLPEWSKVLIGRSNNVLASVVTVFILAVVFSYLFNGIWKLVAFYVLQLFAGRDWIILAERDFFISGLGLRFEESRRYGTSLSLVNMTIGIPNTKKRILQAIYKRLSDSLREIDAISHLENWNNIVVLAPITEKAAENMMGRLVKIVKEELFARGWKEKITVDVGVCSINQEMENEFDLLKPQISAKHEVVME